MIPRNVEKTRTRSTDRKKTGCQLVRYHGNVKNNRTDPCFKGKFSVRVKASYCSDVELSFSLFVCCGIKGTK